MRNICCDLRRWFNEFEEIELIRMAWKYRRYITHKNQYKLEAIYFLFLIDLKEI